MQSREVQALLQTQEHVCLHLALIIHHHVVVPPVGQTDRSTRASVIDNMFLVSTLCGCGNTCKSSADDVAMLTMMLIRFFMLLTVTIPVSVR